jgi:hypothetical protein
MALKAVFGQDRPHFTREIHQARGFAMKHNSARQTQSQDSGLHGHLSEKIETIMSRFFFGSNPPACGA